MKFSNPKLIYQGLGKCIIPLLSASAGCLFLILTWMVFFSNSTQVGTFDEYWIFYCHLSASMMSLLLFLAMGTFACLTLVKKESLLAPSLTSAIAPSGCFMTVLAIGSGAIFGRSIWGTFWVWDLRITGLCLQFLIFFLAMTIGSQPSARQRRSNDVRMAWTTIICLFFIPLAFIVFDFFLPLKHELNMSLVRSDGADAYVMIFLTFVMVASYSTAMVMSRTRTNILAREHRSVWASDGALEGTL